VFLSLTTLGAIYLDPVEPSRYMPLAYVLIVGYAVLSIAVVMMLRRMNDVSPRFAAIMQSVDIAWPGILAIFTAGPASPFFFYFFPLLTAAFRWGLRAAIFTTALGVGFILSDAVVIMLSSQPGHPFGELEINRLVTRTGYIAMMGLLI